MRKRTSAKFSALTSVMIILTGCTLAPEHISQADRAERIAQDRSDMFACQEPVRGTVSLSEAMARALKYNLDLRLKTADSALAYTNYGVTKYDMLPDVVANAGFLSRSNLYAVRQSSESEFISFSQDRHRRIADLQMTWNILDFGVSYIQAKQKGDQYLISLERRRKMEQNIIRDVRYAYFRAVTAQKILRDLDPFLGQIQGALSKSRQLESEQTQSPIEALRYQKSLLATFRQLTTIRKELANARRELGALMNVPPGHRFVLSESIDSAEVLPRGFPMNLSRLEYLALQNRPEVREEDYRTRISADEVMKAKLRMFPGLELTAGLNNDSNSFLVNNFWTNYGSQLTWNLMKIVNGPANIDHAKRMLFVANVRRMALSMAILTQVDVAHLRYREIRKELDVATKEREVARRILTQTRESFEAKKKSEMDLIKAKTDKLLSQLRYDLTYAEWQNAAGQMLNTVGYDMVLDVDINLSVRQLQRKINAALNTEPMWVSQERMPGVYHVAHSSVVQSKPEIKATVNNHQITTVEVDRMNVNISEHNRAQDHKRLQKQNNTTAKQFKAQTASKTSATHDLSAQTVNSEKSQALIQLPTPELSAISHVPVKSVRSITPALSRSPALVKLVASKHQSGTSALTNQDFDRLSSLMPSWETMVKRIPIKKHRATFSKPDYAKVSDLMPNWRTMTQHSAQSQRQPMTKRVVQAAKSTTPTLSAQLHASVQRQSHLLATMQQRQPQALTSIQLEQILPKQNAHRIIAKHHHHPLVQPSKPMNHAQILRHPVVKTHHQHRKTLTAHQQRAPAIYHHQHQAHTNLRSQSLKHSMQALQHNLPSVPKPDIDDVQKHSTTVKANDRKTLAIKAQPESDKKVAALPEPSVALKHPGGYHKYHEHIVRNLQKHQPDQVSRSTKVPTQHAQQSIQKPEPVHKSVSISNKSAKMEFELVTPANAQDLDEDEETI